MINPHHLRSLIADVLRAIDMYSVEATELLMLTAAQESHCGQFLEQLHDGPARGIFQIEPATYEDLWYNFLAYHPELKDKIDMICPGVNKETFDIHLRGNLVYQTIVARMQYYRFPEALPTGNNVDALGEYYKRYWNTELGKATIEEAIRNYFMYAL